MAEHPTLKRLSHESTLKPFTCNNKQLNDFFHDNVLNSSKHLITVTYVLENEKQTIAYFSVLNDCINNRDTETKKRISRKLEKKIPHNKQYPSYPAVKIGRLAVHTEFQKQGFGTQLIDFAKRFFVNNNRTGCRFITVDTYQESLPFYERNGFQYFTDKDANEDTRSMWFDLITFQLKVDVVALAAKAGMPNPAIDIKNYDAQK